MSTQPQPTLTTAEYLEIERDCETKNEFYRGEMFAMGGATRGHNQITFNLAALLHAELINRKCVAYISEMRVKIAANGLYTYPDGVITCQEPQFEDDHLDTMLNPQVIIEVLSESTERYDRGKKFELYRQLETLQEYVLVSQDHVHVERYVRQDQGRWLLYEISGLGNSIELQTINVQLSLSELYTKVEFSE